MKRSVKAVPRREPVASTRFDRERLRARVENLTIRQYEGRTWEQEHAPRGSAKWKERKLA